MALVKNSKDSMDTKLNEVCDELTKTLHAFSAHSSGQLVLDILVHWGYNMVQSNHFDSPRDVGTAFIMRFNALDASSTEHSSTISESEIIWDHHDDSLPKKFSNQFADFPFEDAINTFVMVVNNWFQDSDFASTAKSTNGTKKDVADEIYKGWFYNIW